MELKSIEEEVGKMDLKEKLPRSCQDIEVGICLYIILMNEFELCTLAMVCKGNWQNIYKNVIH